MPSFVSVKAPFTPEVARYVNAVNSRKRTAWVSERPAGVGEKFRSYWCDGSRDEYTAFRGGNVTYIPVSGAYGFTPDPAEWVPQVGDVLVIHGTFMGKPSTPHVIFYK